MDRREKEFVLSSPNGIIVPSGIQWNKLAGKKAVMEFLTREKFPWDILFEATTDPAWRKSLNVYLKSLQKFRLSSGSDALDTEKRYSEDRSRHLEQSKHRIPKTYLEITDNEFRIRVKEFDELEMEISSSKEKGWENGSSQRNENGSTAAMTGAVDGKIGLTPELSSEAGWSTEATVKIANEKYIKQSSILQNMTSIKGKPSLVIKVNELKSFYQEQIATANAIKGIIAATKDVIA